MIRSYNVEDSVRISQIYNYYISHSVATFEEVHVSPGDMRSRIEPIIGNYPFFVLETDNDILGYAYGSQWNNRSAYRYTAEVSVYLDHTAVGKGLGTMLYTRLIEELKNKGYHTLIGGISLPNERSISLHENLGFVKAAHYKEVGFKFGKWIDVGYWQLMF